MRKGPLDRVQTDVEVLFQVSHRNRSDSKRRRVVDAARYRRPRMTDPRHLVSFVEPAVMHEAKLMAEREVGVSGRIVRIKLERLHEKLSRDCGVGIRKAHHMRQRSEIEIVSAQALRSFPAGPLDLQFSETWLDDADHPIGNLILKIKYVLRCAVEFIGPEMGAGLGFDQLRRDAHRAPDLRTPPSKTYRTPSSRPTCRTSTGLPLYMKLELRAITNSHLMRDNPVVMSSTIPSAKYSCSGSPLMFWKGSTAIEGLSGRDSAGLSESASEGACRLSRAMPYA